MRLPSAWPDLPPTFLPPTLTGPYGKWPYDPAGTKRRDGLKRVRSKGGWYRLDRTKGVEPASVSPWLRRGSASAIMLLCLLVFFRDALRTGLHLLYGDSYDAMIEVSILNHWYRVFTAGAAWDVTGYFYPYPATLGYNDTYLIPGIPFALARMAGADPFLAAFASHGAMKALGFVGMYVLLRRGLGVRTPLSLGGAALFTTANVSLVHMYHGQLLSVGLFPWLSFLALWTMASLRQQRSCALVAGRSFGLVVRLFPRPGCVRREGRVTVPAVRTCRGDRDRDRLP